MIIFKSYSKFISIFLILIFIGQKLSASEQNELLPSQIKNFFENLVTLEASFIQVNPSGNVSNGKIYLDLPGKLRIDYKNPNNLLITSQGFWIVIQDRDSKTTNNIPLKSTPFSILLQNSLNLENENFKTEYNVDSGIITLKIKSQNKDKPGGLILEFSEKPFNLKKWIILDTFGESTTVLIQNAKYNDKLSHLLFFPLDFPEPID